MNKELIGIKRNYNKFGYVVKEEYWYHGDDYEHKTKMISAYNYNGDYIGDTKTAYRLCRTYGIKPQTIDKSHTVCSIGFSEKNKAWYGWSHRAIFGFVVGHEIKEGHICQDKFGIGFVAKTLEDCKDLAIEFANQVS